METRTDNEIIAEFMGFKYHANYGYHRDVLYDEAVIDPADPDFVQTPHWHHSWDWLMPVVEKIEKLYHEDFPKDFIQKILAKEAVMDHYLDVIALPLATPISEAYAAVVEFIKWYSNQPQKAS